MVIMFVNLNDTIMQIKMFCISTERRLFVYFLLGQPEAMLQIRPTICYNTKSSHNTMSIDDIV